MLCCFQSSMKHYQNMVLKRALFNSTLSLARRKVSTTARPRFFGFGRAVEIGLRTQLDGGCCVRYLIVELERKQAIRVPYCYSCVCVCCDSV